MQSATFKSAYIYLTLTFLGVSVLVLLIEMLNLFPMPSAMGVITMMIAGLAGGQQFFMQNDRIMSRGERFKFSLVGTAIMIILSIGIAVTATSFYGGSLSLESFGNALSIPAQDVMLVLLVGFGIAAAVGTLMTYIGVGIGQSNQRKIGERAGANR